MTSMMSGPASHKAVDEEDVGHSICGLAEISEVIAMQDNHFLWNETI